jgi:glycerol uptake facilitator-like aquaporin
MTIFENATQQYVTGTLISLLKDNLYIFNCSAHSNPGVSLSLYDTTTNNLLSLQNNTISYRNCVSYGFGCTANILVSLQIDKNHFNNLTSVTCLAKSLVENVSLSANLSQSVIVPPESIF